MTAVEYLGIAWLSVSATAALLALPGTVELLLVTVGALLPGRKIRPRRLVDHDEKKLAVVVPAHNEERHIARCVESLLRDRIAGSEVVVVADNCVDATARRAREAGARVLERNDPSNRGKGFALDFAFETLLSEGVDIVCVIDADSVVRDGFLRSVWDAFDRGADAVQARYGVLNADSTARTRLMRIALMAFNMLRPKGRDRLGFSCGILGNGFALSADVLRALPYEARSVVEDLEYHLRLVRTGKRVLFLDDAMVLADMPETGQGVATQRSRWEGGRLRMLLDHGPALALDLLKGRVRLLEPLLELSLLPLAFHVGLLVVGASCSWLPARALAAGGLLVVTAHVLAAVRVGGGGWRDVRTLCAAPFYVAWKLSMLGRILRASRKEADWVRTDRAPGEPEEPGLVDVARGTDGTKEREENHELIETT